MSAVCKERVELLVGVHLASTLFCEKLLLER